MKPKPETPKKRRITSFEPNGDVASALGKAREGGIKLNCLINAALRRYLEAEGFLKKTDAKKR